MTSHSKKYAERKIDNLRISVGEKKKKLAIPPSFPFNDDEFLERALSEKKDGESQNRK